MSQTEALFPISSITRDREAPRWSIITLGKPCLGSIKRVEVRTAHTRYARKTPELYSVRITQIPIDGSGAFNINSEIVRNP